MRTRVRRALPAILLVALLVAAGCGSGSKTTTASSRSTTSTSSTLPRPAAQPDTAVWPFADSTTRYADPERAAEGFAVDFLGFVDPVIGAFTPGDSRSGEVTVQARSTGPVTTVVVRKLTADGTWWVLAAATPNLQLRSPTAGTSITSPVTLTGQGTAFEGTVNVEVRQDGTLTPVATDFVTGGGNGEMGPFSKAITFSPPTASGGAIVLKTLGGENGVVWEASVVRVQFG